MSFLTSKAEPSHLNNTLHHDRTLATGSRYNPISITNHNTSSFRSKSSTLASSSSSSYSQEFDNFTSSSSSKSSFTPSIIPNLNGPTITMTKNEIVIPGSQQHLQLAAMSPMDGSEVLAFLNDAPSEVYHDEIHGDDLIEGSMSYRSYQHQADHQHSLAELEKLRRQEKTMEEWLLSDDIIDYIQKYDSSYIDDIYGLPPIINNLMKEAKEELKENNNTQDVPLKAVHRLQMIRNHLLGIANGNKSVAVQQGLKMNNDDWTSLF